MKFRKKEDTLTINNQQPTTTINNQQQQSTINNQQLTINNNGLLIVVLCVSVCGLAHVCNPTGHVLNCLARRSALLTLSCSLLVFLGTERKHEAIHRAIKYSSRRQAIKQQPGNEQKLIVKKTITQSIEQTRNNHTERIKR